MQSAYTEDVPVAEIVNGLARIKLDASGNHPHVVTPIHVLRRFCEVTIRTINAWEREQAARPAVVVMGKRGEH